MTKQLMAAVAMMLIAGSGAMPAQTSSKSSKTHKKAVPKAHVESATEREIRELRVQMQGQQAQIDALKQMNADKDAKLASAAADAATANSAAAAATAQAQSVSSSVQANTDAVATLNTTISDLKTMNTGLVQTVMDTKKDLTTQMESPTAWHYKGVLFQPSGFFAAETVFRTRALNSDINTPFNSTVYNNSAQAYTSEFNASGRQTRIAMLVTSPQTWGKVNGYYEMDFLSAGETSNNNQTNSYTARQREAWVQASLNHGFNLTGGQMWSLVTETKKGIVEVPGGENLPQVVDPQYHVGFSFTRQYGLRLSQSLTPAAAVAVSIEASQTILAATTNAPFNFFFGAGGNTGGLYASTGNGVAAQNYSNNVAPDVIVKYTYDPKLGHFEMGGLARFFRDRYYPSATYVGAVLPATTNVGVNDTEIGGGFFVNARVHATQYADVGVHILQGTGTGRYGTSNLGDVTVKPTGTLEPLRNSQGLFSLEMHPTKKLDINGYAGGEYLQRTVYTGFTAAAPTTPVFIGYAPVPGENDTNCGVEVPPTANNGYAPGSSTCTGHTRAIIEGSAGMTYRIFNTPTKGRLQYQLVYSYLTKEAWTGINKNDPSGYGGPKATNNMIHTSLRYYIP